jgi:predicted nuclease of restriction endonuclease-like (RecB) superfamily
VIVDCDSPMLSKILEDKFKENLSSDKSAVILTDNKNLSGKTILIDSFPIDFLSLEKEISSFNEFIEVEEEKPCKDFEELKSEIGKTTEEFVLQLKKLLG